MAPYNSEKARASYERKKEKSRQYYLDNRERLKARYREYYKKNRERIRAKNSGACSSLKEIPTPEQIERRATREQRQKDYQRNYYFTKTKPKRIMQRLNNRKD